MPSMQALRTYRSNGLRNIQSMDQITPNDCLRFYRITSKSGRIICYNRAEKQLAAAKPEVSKSNLFIIAFGVKFRAFPNHLFIITSKNDAGFEESRDLNDVNAMPFELEEFSSGFCSLRNSSTSCYLCAHAIPSSSPATKVEINRTISRDWEKFYLEEINLCDSKSGLQRDLEALDAKMLRIYCNGFDAADVEAEIIFNLIFNNIGEFSRLVKSLSRDKLVSVSKHLAKNKDLIDIMSKAFPDDIWATEALPELSSWISCRQHSNAVYSAKRHTSMLHSSAAARPKVDQTQSTPYMINVALRSTVVPRKKLCILTTMRNEGAYILEWIAWHQSLGVEHFFIYTNNNSDGSEILLEALSESGLITWINNDACRGVARQFLSYGHGLSIVPETLDYEWVAVIDADEFIVIDEIAFRDLEGYLSWQTEKGADAVALNWLMFGTGGRKRWESDFVTCRFLMRQSEPDRHVKTLFKTKKFVHSHCHYPIQEPFTNFVFNSADGSRHSSTIPGSSPSLSDVPVAKGAWLNHYLTKSPAEFLAKKFRGRGDLANDGENFSQHDIKNGVLKNVFSKYISYFPENSYVVDDRAARRRPIIQFHYDALMSLPGVKYAIEHISSRVSHLEESAADAFYKLPSEIVSDGLKAKWLDEAGFDFYRF